MTVESAVFTMTAVRRRIHDALIHHLATDFPDLSAEWTGPLPHDRRHVFCHAVAPLGEPDESAFRYFAAAIHAQLVANHIVTWKMNTIQIYHAGDYEGYQPQENQIFSCSLFDIDHDLDWDDPDLEHIPAAHAAA